MSEDRYGSSGRMPCGGSDRVKKVGVPSASLGAGSSTFSARSAHLTALRMTEQVWFPAGGAALSTLSDLGHALF